MIQYALAPPWPARPWRWLRAAALATVLLAGCTAWLPRLPEDPRHELVAVPFFPQTRHQCGPAALATALGASGVDIDPETLTPEVYLPDRQGSLQVEMLAAARRQGRLAYVIEPSFEALAREIAAGHPVLVLQDLGAFGIHWWHYAVVIGVDPARNLVVLRSGTERRRVVRREHFLKTWTASEHWGVVITRVTRPPATATGPGYVKAVLDAEQWLAPADVAAAYELMQARWPTSPLVLFAAGNWAYAQARLPEAIGDYRALLALEPQHVAGLNNLASALLDAGCPAAALARARQAAGLVDPASSLAAAVADTRNKAEAAADVAATSPPAGHDQSFCAAE